MGDVGEMFREHRDQQAQSKRDRMAQFDVDGWIKLSNDGHYRKHVNGTRFDYWPSTGTVEWRGKYYRGVHPADIHNFIENRKNR